MSRGEIGTTNVRRRTVLQVATTTGLAAALPALHRPSTPKRITTQYVEQLHARTARLRRLDDVLGGGDTYRVYLSEYQSTKAVLRTASTTDDTRRRLLSLLAEQAQQAGWAAFDGGRPAEAGSLYEESMVAARQAGDGDLLGNSYAFLAYQTRDQQVLGQVADSSGSDRQTSCLSPGCVVGLNGCRRRCRGAALIHSTTRGDA
ncbi:hypothetical protein [Streptomyces sp. NPDC048568]|uniref:hypothetical protein n=1 Tax=Streptomyces sp. NPDC048568 TaxID=3365571 RepID=UPI003713C355